MIIDFTIKNWMSFKSPASLQMVGSLERQHGETLTKLPGFRSKKVLPIAGIYGGNASGKTGFFSALAALRSMVVGQTPRNEALPIQSFMLDFGPDAIPTVFDITFLAGSTIYHYVVEATYEKVARESLEIIKENKVRTIYVRTPGAPEQFKPNKAFFTQSDHVFYAEKSTGFDQLFLGNAVLQNVVELAEPYQWFNSTLELIGVGSQASSFAQAAVTQQDFLEFAGQTLSMLDTGIAKLSEELASIDALPNDADIMRQIAELSNDTLMTVVVDKVPGDYDFDMFLVRLVDSRPQVSKLRTVHVDENGKEHIFSLGMESSGTQRLMGLMPMLFDLATKENADISKVYVVDELDRCLHTMLTKRLIEDFVSTCGEKTRKQLLFTTHDLLLMDQSLMRRDEMFIAQRSIDGQSELIGLAEFEGIRFDKDLIRSYLDGRFGGIPMLGKVTSYEEE